MNTTDEKSPVAEFAVCLGSGILADGSASETTLLRAQAALAFSLAHPYAKIILSGDGRKSTDDAVRATQKTEASVMADILIKGGVQASSLCLEDESIDTIGNGVLSVLRFLATEAPGRLYLITSPFHMQRATLSFAGALSSDWIIVPSPCAIASEDAVRGANEAGGLGWVHRFYNGITPGDLAAIKTRLLSMGKAYYGKLERLQPEKSEDSKASDDSKES